MFLHRGKPYYFTLTLGTVLYFQRNSTELWNGLGQSHIQALATAQDINTFFLVLLFGKMAGAKLLEAKSSLLFAYLVTSIFQLVYSDHIKL